MLNELKECLGQIQESLEAYKRYVENIGNAHILTIDHGYIELLKTKAELLMLIARIEENK